jgi:hypothetical protein
MPPTELYNLLGEAYCKELRAEAYQLSKDKQKFVQIVGAQDASSTSIDLSAA